MGFSNYLRSLLGREESITVPLLAFNLGVEAGQLTALVGIIALMNLWRASARFESQAIVANGALMTCGFILIGYQLTGYGLTA